MVYVTLYLDGTTPVRMEFESRDHFNLWNEAMTTIKFGAEAVVETYPDPDIQTDESQRAIKGWLRMVEGAEEQFGFVLPSIESTKESWLKLVL